MAIGLAYQARGKISEKWTVLPANSPHILDSPHQSATLVRLSNQYLPTKSWKVYLLILRIPCSGKNNEVRWKLKRRPYQDSLCKKICQSIADIWTTRLTTITSERKRQYFILITNFQNIRIFFFVKRRTIEG